MLDFIFPEIPEWLATKNLLKSGSIGKIGKTNVTWNFMSYDLQNQIKSWKTDVEQGGGALSFYFSHVLYYLEYFLGRIKTIQSKFILSKKSLNKGETGIEMKLLFKNGCTGNVFLDIASTKEQTHRIEFTGKNESIILQNNTDSFVDNFELVCKKFNKTNKIFPEKNLNYANDTSEDPRVKIVVSIAERFIKWCNTGIESKPNFQDGLRVQELIDMVRNSTKKN